jgi:KaiC/GvpD/RAD55 family RecA-like ATPase
MLKKMDVATEENPEYVREAMKIEFNMSFDDISIDEIRNIVNNYLLQLDDSDNSYSCQETFEDSEEDNIEHRQRWIERIDKLRIKPQPEQRSEEWYKLRANMFTASSDIANILGMGYEKGPAVYKHLMLKKN